jgi:hypothetical protein
VIWPERGRLPSEKCSGGLRVSGVAQNKTRKRRRKEKGIEEKKKRKTKEKTKERKEGKTPVRKHRTLHAWVNGRHRAEPAATGDCPSTQYLLTYSVPPTPSS